MPINISPPPISTEDKTVWNTWYIRVKDAINQLGLNFLWTNIDFSGSSLTDIIDKKHNDLGSLQGGTAGQYYHLTSTQASAISAFNATDWTDLTDGGTSSLHYHWLTATATLDFGSISANTEAELTMTVTGATTGKAVVLGPPSSWESDLTATGFVSAADTVTIRVHNSRGTSVDPASSTWRATVLI